MPRFTGISIMRCINSWLAISGVFKGALCEAPPPWPDRRDFCNYFGIILAPFRDKIAATSDQMRFLAGKWSKMRLRPGLRPGPCWGSLQLPPALPTCLLLTHVALCQRVRGVIAKTRYINVLIDLLTYISSTIYRLCKFWC